MVRNMEKQRLDKFHYHEASDRTHVIMTMINDHICQHPVVRGNKKYLNFADEAIGALYELYQRLGDPNTESQIYKCQYCNKDTSEVDYDYLVGVDHLACVLKKESDSLKKKVEDTFEVCILCGKTTNVLVDTHIDYRTGYIEGAGQLCDSCYKKGTERRGVVIDSTLAYQYPNDLELGAKVRQILQK